MMEESSGSKLTRAVRSKSIHNKCKIFITNLPSVVAKVADIVETGTVETVEVVEVEVVMTTEIGEAVAMMIATEATEAGAETAAIPGKGGAPEMTGADPDLETGRRTGAGARPRAGIVPGVAARASPGAGARQRASHICDNSSTSREL